MEICVEMKLFSLYSSLCENYHPTILIIVSVEILIDITAMISRFMIY